MFKIDTIQDFDFDQERRRSLSASDAVDYSDNDINLNILDHLYHAESETLLCFDAVLVDIDKNQKMWFVVIY